MSEIIEQVGDALREECRSIFGAIMDNETSCRLARVAIAVMREPTDEVGAVYRETGLTPRQLADEVKKLTHENHELRRTRSEAEANSRVAGYSEGQNDLRKSLGGPLGATIDVALSGSKSEAR